MTTIGTKVLPALGTAFETVIGFIISNPITLLIAAIVALVTVIATKGDEIQAELQEIDDYLQNVFAKDWEEVHGPILGGILNDFFDELKEIWDAIKEYLDGVIDFIRGVWTGDWDRAWKGVKEIFASYFMSIDTIINNTIDKLNRLIDLINLVLGTDISRIEYIANAANLMPQTSAITGTGALYSTVLLGTQSSTDTISSILGTSGNSDTSLSLMDILSSTNSGASEYQTNKDYANSVLQQHLGDVNRGINTINMNIYGSQGQDVSDLASLVAEELESLLNQEEEGIR